MTVPMEAGMDLLSLYWSREIAREILVQRDSERDTGPLHQTLS